MDVHKKPEETINEKQKMSVEIQRIIQGAQKIKNDTEVMIRQS
jgi:hypothetical protein